MATLLLGDATDGILVDIGMPVLHKNVRYNCRVFCLNRRIVLIRPKMFMAQDGNYRETRWFTAWQPANQSAPLDAFTLPPNIQMVTSQQAVPFGAAAIDLADTTLAAETCEELFTPNAPHIQLGLDGVEVAEDGGSRSAWSVTTLSLVYPAVPAPASPSLPHPPPTHPLVS
jgi:NAD+ synthase (glutamine-hydrolysing)